LVELTIQIRTLPSGLEPKFTSLKAQLLARILVRLRQKSAAKATRVEEQAQKY
jgi:hypothetical protein